MEVGSALNLGRYLSDIRLELLDCVEQDDLLFLRWNLYGLSRKGRQVTWPGSGFVRFEGDIIASSETFFDTMSLLQQLELIPARVWQTLLQHRVVRGEWNTPGERWLAHQGQASTPRRIVLMPGAVLRRGEIHKALEALDCLMPLGVLVPGGSAVHEQVRTDLFFETGNFGMVVIDAQDRILEANRTFLSLLEERIDQIVGNHFSALLDGEHREAENLRFARFVQQDAPGYPTRVGAKGLDLDLWTSRLERPGSTDLFLKVVREPLRSELGRLSQQHEVQREVLAYDLHDGLAQDLVSLWISLQFRAQMAHRQGKTFDRLGLDQVQEMMQELRSLMRGLQSPFKEGASLTEALQIWASDRGVKLQLEMVELEPLANLLCYQLLTEALASLIPADEFRIALKLQRGLISLLVQGKPQASPSRDSLEKLRRSCELLGGQLEWTFQSKGILSLQLSLAEWGAIERRTD